VLKSGMAKTENIFKGGEKKVLGDCAEYLHLGKGENKKESGVPRNGGNYKNITREFSRKARKNNKKKLQGVQDCKEEITLPYGKVTVTAEGSSEEGVRKIYRRREKSDDALKPSGETKDELVI